MKKLFPAIIVVCMLSCCFASSVQAMANNAYSTSLVILERTRNTITGNKEYYQLDSSGSNTICKATLTGSFTYNGTNSSCTGASCNVTIYNSSWSTKSVNAYTSGNSAIADVAIERKFLFITLETINFSITLSCDRYGNLT